MGFWDCFLDSEVQQRDDINWQQGRIDHAISEISRLRQRVRSLEAELDATKKGCKVMLEVLIEQGLITEEAFSKKVTEVSQVSVNQDSDWVKRRLNSQE